MSVKLCLAALAVFLCVHSAASIQCYVCNSNTDKGCMASDPPDSLKKDCLDEDKGAQNTLCRKIVQHIDFEVNGLPPDHRVIRTCGWQDSAYKDRCYQRAGFGGRQEVCSCESDFCNSAPRLSIVPSLLAAAVAALVRSLFF